MGGQHRPPISAFARRDARGRRASIRNLCAPHASACTRPVRRGADDRQALEQLCRYITRPALANERVQLSLTTQRSRLAVFWVNDRSTLELDLRRSRRANLSWRLRSFAPADRRPRQVRGRTAASRCLSRRPALRVERCEVAHRLLRAAPRRLIRRRELLGRLWIGAGCTMPADGGSFSAQESPA